MNSDNKNAYFLTKTMLMECKKYKDVQMSFFHSFVNIQTYAYQFL